MGIASRFVAAVRAARGAFRNPQTRGFNAAAFTKALSDWFAAATSADAEIRRDLRRLVDRSRDLERNNDYLRGFLLSAERNVIGAVRDDVRMDCGEFVKAGRDKAPEWQPDPSASQLIGEAWREWSMKGTCTVCGRYSWRAVKRLAVRAVVRDGTILIRKRFGAAARNRFGFALEVWEIDHLDLERFTALANGNEVRFGIESDSDQRVVAFWVRVRHPGDLMTTGQTNVVRLDASQFYHVFVPERPGQSVGIPWVVSAITRLRQLGAFEEAATIAARVGASQGGFLTKTPGAGGSVAEWTGERSADGKGVIDASPLAFQELPEGWNVQTFTPEYPNITTGDFRKAMLRGVATSVGSSYTSLGNDLESVNFSSARVGLFEEREGWKMIQAFFSEELFEPVFSDFLTAAIAGSVVPLPLDKFRKFNRPVFKQRRWPFIDPLKEIQAAGQAIALRIGSRRGFIEEQGGDVEDVMHDNLDDENLAKKIGLSLSPPDPQPEAFGDVSTAGAAADSADDETDPEKPLAKPPKK